MLRQPLTRLLLGLAPLLRAGFCTSSASGVKRELGSIRAEYDYIVIGGGTSGLVVASRLSENANSTVLVVEYGDFANTINVTVPYFTTLDQTPRLYSMTSVPQVHLSNREQGLRTGRVVGGGSTVNGMAWDRGSAIDYDSWEKLGNPSWNWKTMLRYFRKSSQFAPPADEYVQRYGYNWSSAAYGNGPIHVGFPAWQWPAAGVEASAWANDMDVPVLADGANGQNVGLAWLPQNSDGIQAVRSSAETAYYQPASRRPNLHLLVRHYGAAVKFEGNSTVGVEITSHDDSDSRFIASKNVVLAAGTVNTPRILQLSGIGPAKLLQSLDIDVIVDAPGVGANFQDHSSFFVFYQFNNDSNPSSDSMNDPAFYDAAWEEYTANKTGPFSHGWGNHIVFASLQDLDNDFLQIADALGEQEPLAYLPATYAENPSLLKGFIRQSKVMQSQLRSPEAGVVEITFGGAPSVIAALQKPLSRGTISINTTNANPNMAPLIDFNTNANPVDMIMIRRALQKIRTFMASDTVAVLAPVELSPGPTVQSDVEIEAAMRDSLLRSSFDHPVGTAAMMPRDEGGVVDASLRVYGVEGLWVVDASIMPILIAAHTQATVYAVAEYASELIRSHGQK
ncbi:GMC oxidoreductase [Stachybotrys elegans]|uniref:GMC oxidoreductase n=1 Tax=Stachybotrys elegans TaxID=80388 RepID=A0A8K0WM36_9HYPO|nr:GMC oxidoreductase [Stachybotrys elegans]